MWSITSTRRASPVGAIGAKLGRLDPEVRRCLPNALDMYFRSTNEATRQPLSRCRPAAERSWHPTPLTDERVRETVVKVTGVCATTAVDAMTMSNDTIVRIFVLPSNDPNDPNDPND